MNDFSFARRSGGDINTQGTRAIEGDCTDACDRASDAQGVARHSNPPRVSEPAPPNTQAAPNRLTRYFGSVELDPVKASLEFSRIVSELVELFSATPGTQVRIRVDIEAEDARGFGEGCEQPRKTPHAWAENL